MKKFLLSFLVLGVFFVYGLHERNEKSEAKVIPSTSPQNPQTQAVLHTQQAPFPTNQPASGYKDGLYTGSVEDVFYGNLQVQAMILGGKITDIQFLQYPNDRDTSTQINEAAIPILRQEAIKVQDASVDVISGATDSSRGFQRSLKSALDKATS